MSDLDFLEPSYENFDAGPYDAYFRVFLNGKGSSAKQGWNIRRVAVLGCHRLRDLHTPAVLGAVIGLAESGVELPQTATLCLKAGTDDCDPRVIRVDTPGSYLGWRASATPKLAALAARVSALEEALAAHIDDPEAHAAVAGAICGLADAVSEQAAADGVPADLHPAVKCWRSGPREVCASVRVSTDDGDSRILTTSEPVSEEADDDEVIGAAATCVRGIVKNARSVLGLEEDDDDGDDDDSAPYYATSAPAIPPAVAALAALLRRAQQGDAQAQAEVATLIQIPAVKKSLAKAGTYLGCRKRASTVTGVIVGALKGAARKASMAVRAPTKTLTRALASASAAGPRFSAAPYRPANMAVPGVPALSAASAATPSASSGRTYGNTGPAYNAPGAAPAATTASSGTPTSTNQPGQDDSSAAQPDTSQQDYGSSDGGGADYGPADDYSSDDGSGDGGGSDFGPVDDGSGLDDGSGFDDGSTDDGSGDGSTDDGSTDDGSSDGSDDGSTDDGSSGDGSTDDGSSDGSY